MVRFDMVRYGSAGPGWVFCGLIGNNYPPALRSGRTFLVIRPDSDRLGKGGYGAAGFSLVRLGKPGLTHPLALRGGRTFLVLWRRIGEAWCGAAE